MVDIGHGWDLNSSRMSITTPCLGHRWLQFWFGLVPPHFKPRDGVCLDWFQHFTSSYWPFQWLINGMMNVYTRLGWDWFNGYGLKCSPQTNFESWLELFGLANIHVSHQDYVTLDSSCNSNSHQLDPYYIIIIDIYLDRHDWDLNSSLACLI